MTTDNKTSTPNPKIPIGISSCLMGEKVRFDGGHKNSPYITQTLTDYFEFQPFCPEVAIGLGIPRETIRLIKDDVDGDARAVGVKNPDKDVTQALADSARQQFHWVEKLAGYIFKKDSPSCGMERVKVYYKTTPARNGIGIYAQAILEHFPNLPTEEEGRLGDPRLRENFIKRVFIYQRWRELVNNNPSKNALVEFHARHKLIYMSHNQNDAKLLGQLVARIGDLSIDDYCEQYLTAITALLKKPASQKNHVNTLKHIQGYLKRDLDSGDKQELHETIEQYRLGYLPLIVPITLLRHHFRRCPNDYIDQSFYMQPHPSELMLRNLL